MRTLISMGVFLATVLHGIAFADASKTKGVTFISRTQNNAVIWYPGSVEVGDAERLIIHAVNELDQPHGFSIPGLVEPMVVEPFSSQRVEIALKTAGNFSVECHLHPPHQKARLIVVQPKE